MFTYQWCWGAEAVLFVLTEPKFTSSTPAYDFRGKKLELEAQKTFPEKGRYLYIIVEESHFLWPRIRIWSRSVSVSFGSGARIWILSVCLILLRKHIWWRKYQMRNIWKTSKRKSGAGALLLLQRADFLFLLF